MGLIFILHRHKIMGKIHLLVNLTSGSNRGEKALEQIETVLKNEKMDYDIHISNYPGQLVPIATKVANEISSGNEYVIVVGGDGSLNQALNGVKIQSSLPLPLPTSQRALEMILLEQLNLKQIL